MTLAIFHQGLKNGLTKFHDFPGRVVTLILLSVEWCRYLEVSVDDASSVHVFQAEDHFTCVEADLVLKERAVLWEVVVQVAAVH